VLQQGHLLGVGGKDTAKFRDSKIFLQKNLVDSKKIRNFATDEETYRPTGTGMSSTRRILRDEPTLGCFSYPK